MALFTSEERRYAETIGLVGCSNPFLPERIDWERAALGPDFDERFADWNLQRAASHSPNVPRLLERTEAMLSRIEKRTHDQGAPAGLAMYENWNSAYGMCLFVVSICRHVGRRRTRTRWIILHKVCEKGD